MTLFKGLLLSSASVLVVAGAQAADLPVKAKPVEYVKICSIYGQGFYYIPGTDTCIRFGGYIRADYGYGVTGARTPQYTGAPGRHDRTTSPYTTRHRFRMFVDTRTQTAYGTLRTFGTAQWQNENEGDEFNVPRAFIQWAGFTFGRTQSFTDSISIGGSGFGGSVGSLHQTQNQSNTSPNGTNQIAYTWELGNGMTLSIGADERRVRSIANWSNSITNPGADPTSTRGGAQNPNPWIAFKVDQAWGRFSAAFIANKNNATYYGANAGVTGYNPSVACQNQPVTTFCNHPDDEWGWAILTGGEIKTPFIAPRDALYWYVNYGQGATRYAGGSNLASPGLFGSGNEVALGVVTDAVYVNGSQLELTTAWSAGGGYVHWWTNSFNTAVYGTYTEVTYNDTVVNNGWFCGSGGGVNQNIRIPTGAACDPSFRFWSVGSVTSWFPVAGLRLAVDVLYVGVDTAFAGPVALVGGIGTRPTGGYLAEDQGTLSVIFRAQRNW